MTFDSEAALPDDLFADPTKATIARQRIERAVADYDRRVIAEVVRGQASAFVEGLAHAASFPVARHDLALRAEINTWAEKASKGVA